MQLVRNRLHAAVGFADIDPENQERLVLQRLLQADEIRHLADAGRTPACPEVDEYRLSVEFAERARAAVEIRQIDFGTQSRRQRLQLPGSQRAGERHRHGQGQGQDPRCRNPTAGSARVAHVGPLCLQDLHP